MNPMIFVGVCLLATMATSLTASVLHVPLSHIQLPEHLTQHLSKQHPRQSSATLAYRKHLAELAGPRHMSKHPRAQIRMDQEMSTPSTPTVSNPIPLDQPTYYLTIGNITAGTPPQQFTVSIDLWQEDLYLIGVGADGASGESNSTKNQYDKSASSTYQNPNGNFSADYGYVTGALANDRINLGDLNVDLTFGDADSIDWWVSSLPIDGVLGLSILKSKNNISNVREQLASQMSEPVIVMHTNDQTDDSFIVFGSEQLPQCQQQWTHLPNGNLTGNGVSGLNVTGIQIEGSTNSLTVANRPLDIVTWTTTKYVSNQTRDLLVQASGATLNKNSGRYELPCENMAQAKNVLISLSVEKTLTITPNDYVRVTGNPNNGTQVCFLDVIGYYDEHDSSYSTSYLELDQRFFNTRCVSYNSNTKELGLALLSQKTEGSTGPTPQPSWGTTPQ